MAKKHKRTKHLNWSEESMAAAIEDVRKGMTYERAAKIHKVPRATLYDKVKKAEREGLSSSEAALTRLGRFKTFSDAQEEEFVQHILLLKERFFFLTTTDICKLAYEFAEENNIPHKFNREKKSADNTWYYSVRSRHKQLLKGFNRTPVKSFFNSLESVYNKYQFSRNDIYNVSETSIIIEPNKSIKVLALRGRRFVSDLASKVELITVATCMNAAGNYMPTMFIFPRKELVSHVLMPSIAVYHESGLIQKDSFINWFNQFIEFSRASPEKPVLLLLDGHASHTKSMKLIKLAQENNVIILSFPPHFIHWLQPLDILFLDVLKAQYKKEVKEWQNKHQGHVKIREVAKLYEKAFSRAAKEQAAIDVFEKSGIYPLNKNVLAGLDAPSKTTEKPMQQKIQDDETRSQEEKNIQKRNEKRKKTAILISSPYKKQKTATRKRKLEIEAPKVEKLNKKEKQKDSSSSD